MILSSAKYIGRNRRIVPKSAGPKLATGSFCWQLWFTMKALSYLLNLSSRWFKTITSLMRIHQVMDLAAVTVLRAAAAVTVLQAAAAVTVLWATAAAAVLRVKMWMTMMMT